MARLELELDGARLKTGAEQAEQSLEGVKSAAVRTEKSIDQLGKSGARDMQRLSTETRKAAASQTALQQATQRVTRGFSGARGQIQNVSFQVGDFATQVGAGTAASVALGQQLPQLLGGFGALGAVFGAVVAIGVPLAAALFRSGEGAKSAADAISDLDQSTSAALDALKRSKLTVSELAEEYGGYADAIREVLAVQAEVAVASVVSDAATAVSSLDAGPLSDILRLMEQVEGATGPAALSVSGLRQEISQFPPEIQSAAQAYIRLREADSTEEQKKLAGELLLELRNIDGAGFQSLRGEVSDLITSLRDAAVAARTLDNNLPDSVLNAKGRGGAGPGGPLIGSVDAQLLRQGITPTDEDAPLPTAKISSGASKATTEVNKLNTALMKTGSGLTEAEKAAQSFNDRMDELQNLDQFVADAGESLQQSLSDFLFNPFETGVRGMVLQFSDALRRMASDAISAQITQAIFNGIPGFGGGFGGLGSVGGIPLYDAGGYIPSGQAGMVAEKRPEVVNGQAVDMPSIVRGPANVQGGAATGRAAAAAPVVNQKTVVALSTSDLASEVTADPSFETRVIQIGLQQGWA